MRSIENRISGGSTETELNELMVRPIGLTVGGFRRDDGDAGGKLPERLTEGARIEVWGCSHRDLVTV